MKRIQNNLLFYYWRLVIKPHLGKVLVVLSLMLTAAVFDMATVGLGVPLLETATHSEQASKNQIVLVSQSILRALGFSTEHSVVLFALLLLLSATAILHGGLVLLQQYATAAIAQILRREVKRDLFQRILFAPYSYFADKSRGAVLYNLNTPAVSVFQVITYGVKLCQGLFNSLLMIALMVYLSWWATIFIAILGVLWVQGWRQIIDKRSSQRGRELYDLEGKINKLEVDAIDGLQVVKAHGLFKQMVDRQFALLKAEYLPHLRLTLLTHGISFINELVACLVVVFIGGLALGFENLSMPFSKLVVFFIGVRRVSTSLAGINSAYSQLHRERKGMEVMEEILHKVSPEQLGTGTLLQVHEIGVENLGFFYPSKGDQPVLNGLDLTLKRGEITALVGSTGAGKSTLASLLLGFYQPTSGRILINGGDLKELDLAGWRQKIGFVSQNVFLFNDTIRENIALWDSKLSEEEIREAAKLAQMHDFISSLPEGYETIVGDRGMKLSGGQAQRVAIARAILRQPEVLIFDEATSALDNLTERAVYNAINSLRQNAVVIVIAHRLSTIKDADQIAVLQSGRLVEIGTHETLLNRKNVYAKLYQVVEENFSGAVLAT